MVGRIRWINVAIPYISNFSFLISAGHIWKFITLAYIPPTIAGIVLAYRGKYLAGGIVTALFIALQILSNHVQMSYYFLFVILFIAGAYFEDAWRNKTLPQFFKASGVLVVAALIGISVNLSNLYHTYEYSKETMRDKSELVETGTSVLNARTAAESLKTNIFDLVLLDINLPDGNGYDLCRLIKPEHPDTVVIFLTANDQESDQIRGYEAGAVDYITKPFSISALQRKIKAMFAMLEHHKPAKDIYEDGSLFLDFSEQFASLNGKPLALSAMEYKMLNLFLKNTAGQLGENP